MTRRPGKPLAEIFHPASEERRRLIALAGDGSAPEMARQNAAAILLLLRDGENRS